MYKVEKKEFVPTESYHRDRRIIIEAFQKFGALEDNDNFYLPDEVVNPLEESPTLTGIPNDLCDYFELVSAIESKSIPLEKIVGSADSQNLRFKNWLGNFYYYGEESLSTYLELSNPITIFTDKSVTQGNENTLKAYEVNDKYYLVDGHHRFSCLYIHYQILKSQNRLPTSFKVEIPALVKIAPNDKDFVSRFVNFCAKYNLYNEDEFGVIPQFKVIDSNPDNPILLHCKSQVIITKDTDLEEAIKQIHATDEVKEPKI